MGVFDTEEFLALRKLWDSKLKKSGFDDIEDRDSSKEFLLKWSSRYFRSYSHSTHFRSHAAYYQKAGRFLHEYRFLSGEKMIWKFHSEGLVMRDIAHKCKTTLYYVFKVLTKLENKMLDWDEEEDEMTDDKLKELIIVREWYPDDEAFIYETWLKGLYFGNLFYQEVPSKIFYSNYHKILEEILSRPTVTVKIACLPDETDVILGYAVLEQKPNRNILHWAFTKLAWRKMGIAKKLIPDTTQEVSHLTKQAKSLMKRNWIFNPFLF